MSTTLIGTLLLFPACVCFALCLRPENRMRRRKGLKESLQSQRKRLSFSARPWLMFAVANGYMKILKMTFYDRTFKLH